MMDSEGESMAYLSASPTDLADHLELESPESSSPTRCTSIQSLQELFFSSSTTAQPILTPRSLMKELDDVGKRPMLNSLLQLKEATLEHCEKNEIVKHHSQEVGLQRQVFVDFFCDPDHLRNQVGELTARVRALQAS